MSDTETQRDDDDAAQDAREEEDANQKAEEEMKALEEDPPEKLEDWPGGKAKYKTFGGPEHQTGYDEAATEKLGPADLRHHEDGSVSIKGEKVDNPEDYKGEPIPGGPTDPNAPEDLGLTKTARDKGSGEGEGDAEGDKDSEGGDKDSEGGEGGEGREPHAEGGEGADDAPMPTGQDDSSPMGIATEPRDTEGRFDN